MISPGMTPPMKSRPIETPAMTPKTTAGTLGGMIGPMIDEAPVTARLKSSS
jgi:hypothetical protein